MDYGWHYSALINRARARTLDGYCERHHVLPRCLGGNDEPQNIVALTPEEHFVAHQLLVKMHPGDRRLVFAAWAMTQGKWRSNKKFGWLRRRRAEVQRSFKMSAEARAKISASRLGKKLTKEQAERLHAARRAAGVTDETRAKLSAINKGKQKTESHRAALSAARRSMEYTPELREKLAANRGKKMSEKQRAALLAATKGKPLSDEHRAKVSAAKLGKKQPNVECPRCHKAGGTSLMKRWHFDNCRSAA